MEVIVLQTIWLSLSGKVLTIERGCDAGYRVEEFGFFWTDEMLEPIEEKVITNKDKLIEDFKKMSEEEFYKNSFLGCTRCINYECNRCKGDYSCADGKIEWLKQPYKEPSILDEEEKEYIKAVCKPFEVQHIRKEKTDEKNECIKIVTRNKLTYTKIFIITLPLFKQNTMYAGMKLNKDYILEELLK